MVTTTRAKRGTRPLLVVDRPDIAAQAVHPETVALLTTGSNKRVEWECARAHRWTAPVHARVRATGKNGGCPYCFGRLTIPGETDIATTHPKYARQLRNTDPATVSAGSIRKFDWECERGHQWQASMANRIARGSECPYCVGRLAIPGETDIATTHPDYARQVVDADPTTLGRGSSKAVTWCCDLGHRWTATPNTRINMKTGCPYCTGKRTWPGFNDLLTRFPLVGSEARGADPATLAPSSTRRIEWECMHCSARWRANVSSRTKSDTPGCSACRGGGPGFRVTEPAHLYLLHRTRHGITELKVGITNNTTIRFTHHRRYGWEPLDVSPPMLGADALNYEQTFLRHLDSLGVPRGKRRAATPEPGYTETWNAADYPVEQISEIVTAVTETRTTHRGTQ
jgi:hypothetical protein